MDLKQLLGVLIIFTTLAAGCMPGSVPIEAPEETRIQVAATKGYYTDRVTVSWSEVENADYYVIYRAPAADGPYEEIAVVNPNNPERRVENAEESITVYPEPVVRPDDWIDPRYLNISYVTEKDLSDDVYIAAKQNPKLRIVIGSGPVKEADLDCVIEFPSLVGWLPTTWKLGYTIGQVMSRINDRSDGKFICELDPDSDKYLKINSEWGPIAFINHDNSLFYSPVDYIINGDVGKSQMLIVNKDGTQIIDKSDFTGNMSDYFGTEIPADPDPDPDPIVIMRIFPEGNGYYYDDLSVELGVHYFYRVVARDENNALLSMSTCNEGYYISANASNAPQNLTISQGEFSDKVTVSWDPVSGDGITYKVYRALVYPGTFDSASILAERLTEPTFEDTTIDAGVYAYRVVAFNSEGEEGKPSDIARGYRTITLDEFVPLAYYETVVGEQLTAQALGVSRVADYDNGANADVTLPGYLSGTINYKLVISGMSGNGKWTFVDYSNFGLIVNGSDDMDSGPSKDGDVRGKLAISGPYPGYLDYFLHVDGGDVEEGSKSYFMVQLYSAEWMLSNYGAEEVRIDYSLSLTESPY
jgi:hypothetical protein